MTTNEITRPKCKHTFDITPGGAISVTLDGAAMLRGATTCEACEIDRLEDALSREKNRAASYKDLWEQSCEAVAELCDLAEAPYESMHDLWTLKTAIERLKARVSPAPRPDALRTAPLAKPPTLNGTVSVTPEQVVMTRDHYDALQRTVARLEAENERLDVAKDANREALLEANRMVVRHSMPYGWPEFQAKNMLPESP